MQLSQLYAYVLARYYCSGSHHWRFVRPSAARLHPSPVRFFNVLHGKTLPLIIVPNVLLGLYWYCSRL